MSDPPALSGVSAAITMACFVGNGTPIDSTCVRTECSSSSIVWDSAASASVIPDRITDSATVPSGSITPRCSTNVCSGSNMIFSNPEKLFSGRLRTSLRNSASKVFNTSRIGEPASFRIAVSVIGVLNLDASNAICLTADTSSAVKPSHSQGLFVPKSWIFVPYPDLWSFARQPGWLGSISAR